MTFFFVGSYSNQCTAILPFKIFCRISSAYHCAHCNAGPSGVDSSVNLRMANSDVAVEGDGAHVEEGADADGQTQ